MAMILTPSSGSSASLHLVALKPQLRRLSNTSITQFALGLLPIRILTLPAEDIIFVDRPFFYRLTSI